MGGKGGGLHSFFLDAITEFQEGVGGDVAMTTNKHGMGWYGIGVGRGHRRCRRVGSYSLAS